MFLKSGVAIVPALVPLLSFLFLRKSDSGYPVTRSSWEKEYDYIIGEWNLFIVNILIEQINELEWIKIQIRLLKFWPEAAKSKLSRIQIEISQGSIHVIYVLWSEDILESNQDHHELN